MLYVEVNEMFDKKNNEKNYLKCQALLPTKKIT